MPTDDGNPVESLIHRIHVQIQNRVCVRADQPLIYPRRLLAVAREQQSRARLAHTRFHTWIWRVFSAALQGDFDTRCAVLLVGMTGGYDAFLPQSSSIYVKREGQVSASPFEWPRIFLTGEEVRRHQCADSYGAGRFDEASSIREHKHLVIGSPDIRRAWRRIKGKLCGARKHILPGLAPAPEHGGRRCADRTAASHRFQPKLRI